MFEPQSGQRSVAGWVVESSLLLWLYACVIILLFFGACYDRGAARFVFRIPYFWSLRPLPKAHLKIYTKMLQDIN